MLDAIKAIGGRNCPRVIGFVSPVCYWQTHQSFRLQQTKYGSFLDFNPLLHNSHNNVSKAKTSDFDIRKDNQKISKSTASI